MRNKPRTFLWAGLFAGVTSAVVGRVFPAVLTVGVGLLFFVAVVASTTLTSALRQPGRDTWRYAAAASICTVGYIMVLLVFNVTIGYSQGSFSITQSDDIVQFGADIWLGLIASGIVASVGVAFVGSILTGRWSTSFVARLIGAALITIAFTNLVNVRFHQYWSFIGVLFAVGNALFCWLVGREIWKSHDELPRENRKIN